MSQPVLLDNTVLTNFALIGRSDLVLDLWPDACTTPAVQAEYQAGVTTRQLPVDVWQSLPIVTLTSTEATFANRLNQRLGAGERSCMAVARHQKGLFVSDDLDARRQAQAYGIPTTGTIGILLLNIQHKRIALAKGNELLTQLIKLGYRSQSPNSTTLSKYPEPNKATLLMPFSDWTRLLKKKTAATDWRHKASAAAIL